MENPKKTLGRRKIEIKKIEKKTSLQVAFTKRRGGLFRKASELAVLCGAEVAILVQSPAEKLYSFGNPSVEALINRAVPSPAAAAWQIRREYEGRIKYEEAAKRLEAEKMRAAEKKIGGGLWCEESYEGLQLQELEQLLKSLEDSGGKVEQNLKNNAPPLSIQQLIAADNFVIATDNFYDDEEGLVFFN